MQAVAAVAGEVLVGAIAGESDLDLPACQFTNTPGGQSRAVCKGFVIGTAERGQQTEIIGLNLMRTVTRVVAAGNLPRVVRFIERFVVKANRAGIDAFLRSACHQGN